MMFSNRESSSDAILDLEKGDILDLTKVSPSLKHVILAAGWHANDAGKLNFDLDLSAFLLDASGKVKKSEAGKRVVYFNNTELPGIYLEEDNTTGSDDDSEGDDERIHVNLDEVPCYVQEIVFNVNIYHAMEKKQTFGMVKNSYVKLLDADNNEKEICNYYLKENASNATAIVFVKLIRNKEGGWSYETIGESYTVKDLNAILSMYLKS